MNSSGGKYRHHIRLFKLWLEPSLLGRVTHVLTSTTDHVLPFQEVMSRALPLNAISQFFINFCLCTKCHVLPLTTFLASNMLPVPVPPLFFWYMIRDKRNLIESIQKQTSLIKTNACSPRRVPQNRPSSQIHRLGLSLVH